ncbi:MAG: hypothetical protein PHT54_01115 [Candidatus Nanoarchaeia archaeon]|nr:hypothetical protein [Candidatus Nanoarchaeia archaeon]
MENNYKDKLLVSLTAIVDPHYFSGMTLNQILDYNKVMEGTFCNLIDKLVDGEGDSLNPPYNDEEQRLVDIIREWGNISFYSRYREGGKYVIDVNLIPNWGEDYKSVDLTAKLSSLDLKYYMHISQIEINHKLTQISSLNMVAYLICG